MKNLNSFNRFKTASGSKDINSRIESIYRFSKSKQALTAFAKKFSFDWKSSFSTAKKNFFKFNLETTLIVLMLVGVGINVFAGNYEFKNGQNRYLAYLVANPELNSNIIERLETENISIAPRKINFVLAAQAATLDSLIGVDPIILQNNEEPESLIMLASSDSVIIKPNMATLDANLKKDIREYIVENGDSVSRIASEFGVSVQTVLYENGLSEDGYIRPGQILSILPTTGIKHTVKEGETGVFFKKQNAESIGEAIRQFGAMQFNAEHIREHAAQFSSEKFRGKLKEIVLAEATNHTHSKS